MAIIIEFHVPSRYTKKAVEWTALEKQGKVIPFAVPQKKSA
jgi:hypothetical protein